MNIFSNMYHVMVRFQSPRQFISPTLERSSPAASSQNLGLPKGKRTGRSLRVLRGGTATHTLRHSWSRGYEPRNRALQRAQNIMGSLVGLAVGLAVRLARVQFSPAPPKIGPARLRWNRLTVRAMQLEDLGQRRLNGVRFPSGPPNLHVVRRRKLKYRSRGCEIRLPIGHVSDCDCCHMIYNIDLLACFIQ